MVDWDYFDRFEPINERLLPSKGEGENKATQTVTAVNKLIYKWYNDGDVYDNRFFLNGWYNDLSSYANWIYKYTDFKELNRIAIVSSRDEYEDLLKNMADTLLDEDMLKELEKEPKVGSIYDCDGPFVFVENNDEDDDEKGVDQE